MPDSARASTTRLNVQLAVFCKDIITDTQGQSTLVRIFDVLNIPIPPGAQPEQVPARFFVAIRVAPDEPFDELPVRLLGQRPDGALLPAPVAEATVSCPAPFTSSGLHAEMITAFVQSGVHWFIVEIDGQVVTKFPLDVRLNFVAPEESAIPQSPQDASGP